MYAEDKARNKRINGKGSIVKRGRIYFGRWMIAGKIYTRSLKTANRREAEAKLAEIMKPFVARDEAASLANTIARLEGVKSEIAKYEDERPALRFEEAFPIFQSRMGKTSDSTLKIYAGQFNRLAQWVRDHYPDCRELRNLDSAMARSFLAHISNTLSPNSYNKYLTLMRMIWKKLADAIRAKEDPWAEFENKRLDRRNGRRALTLQELADVCATLDGEMRILFALGIYTGLRLGDCALLKWSSVDLVRGLITVLPRKTAKTGREITISIHPTLMPILGSISRESIYVLPQSADLYLRDSSALVARIQKAFAAAGIETQTTVDGYAKKIAIVGFHSLRHTFVSMCGNAGLPLAYVQSLVGHANPMMTARYFHADTEAHRAQLNAALPNVINCESIETPILTQPFKHTQSNTDIGVICDTITRLDALSRE